MKISCKFIFKYFQLKTHLFIYEDCSETNNISSSWSTGASGVLNFKVPETTSGWTITVTFDKNVTGLHVWNGENEICIGKACTFKNKSWNKNQYKDYTLNLGYGISYLSSPVPQVVELSFNSHNICGDSVASTTTTTTTTTPATTTSGIIYIHLLSVIYLPI